MQEDTIHLGGNPVTRVGVTSGISNTSREEKEGSKCTSRSIMEVHHKAHAWTSTSAALKWASYLFAAHIALLRHRRLLNTSEALNNVIPGKNHIVRITSECTIERYYNQWEPHNMLKPQESPTQQSCWTSNLKLTTVWWNSSGTKKDPTIAGRSAGSWRHLHSLEEHLQNSAEVQFNSHETLARDEMRIIFREIWSCLMLRQHQCNSYCFWSSPLKNASVFIMSHITRRNLHIISCISFRMDTIVPSAITKPLFRGPTDSCSLSPQSGPNLSIFFSDPTLSYVKWWGLLLSPHVLEGKNIVKGINLS